MPTSGRLGARLLTSGAVSLLAASAAVLAHLVAAGHRPGVGLVVAVALVLGLADATVATLLRGTWGLAVRTAALQVVAHGALTTAAAVTGTTHAATSHAGSAGHHAVSLGAQTATADLVPSAPMLTAHLVVAVVVAALLVRTGAGTRAAVEVPGLVRAVVALLRLVLPHAVRPVRVRPARVRADVPAVPRRESVWTGASPVRRGPPVLV